MKKIEIKGTTIATIVTVIIVALFTYFTNDTTTVEIPLAYSSPINETQTSYSYRDTLSQNDILLYDKILKTVEAKSTETINTAKYGVSQETLTNILMYVTLDNPQIYWFPTGSKCSGTTNNIITISFDGFYQLTEDTNAASYEKALDSLMTEVNTSDNKTQAAYKLLKEMNEYDGPTQNDMTYQSAYSAFCTGKTVCMGWSKAYKVLMDQAGIDCKIVLKNLTKDKDGSTLLHAYNVINIDGREIIVDLTNGVSPSDNMDYDTYIDWLKGYEYTLS